MKLKECIFLECRFSEPVSSIVLVTFLVPALKKKDPIINGDFQISMTILTLFTCYWLLKYRNRQSLHLNDFCAYS